MNEECGDRIAELQQVEKKICELLRESGLAIQCLAPGESIQPRKEEFEKHAEDFARLLEEVTTALRRNIFALSKASNSVAGEHSSMTVTARDKDNQTWDRIREIIREM